jgi:hypothetical protein
MVDQARNGISISHQELSEEDQLINLLISTTQVNLITCNTLQPTQDGGKSGSTTELISAMSEMERKSPFQEVKMLKLNQFGPSTSIEENIQLSFGRLSTPITWVMKPIKPRVLTKISDSKLTKSSTSDQNANAKSHGMCRSQQRRPKEMGQ